MMSLILFIMLGKKVKHAGCTFFHSADWETVGVSRQRGTNASNRLTCKFVPAHTDVCVQIRGGRDLEGI